MLGRLLDVGLDDDRDGAIDCADADCAAATLCSGSGSLPLDSFSGPMLLVDRGAGIALELSWGSSCFSADDDFAVYEGLLGVPGSHTPDTCSVGGASSWTVTSPGDGNRYYLVVPRNAAFEGSYGKDGAGAERPQGAFACLAQSVACP